MARAKWVDVKTMCDDGWHERPTQPTRSVAPTVTIEDDDLSFEDAPTTEYVPLSDDDPEQTVVDAPCFCARAPA